MAHSSPEGIVLGKGSELASFGLSINEEKVINTKKPLEQILKELELVNPAHLRMVSNGHGEFPDGYKLTEQGVKYILEKINK
jgi:hypothetical protein